MPPAIVDTYLNHVRQSVAAYGPRTLVLLECGSFYEIYDVVPTEASAHLRCCRDVLGILVTRKNKGDPKSAYMAGIPTQSIRRYFKLLLQRNYTVVVIGQKGTPNNITRDVTQVLSPGCNLSEEVHESTDAGQSVLAALLFEDAPTGDGDCYAYLATFDTNRGTTHLETVTVDATTSGSARHVMDDLCTALHETLQTHLFHELCVYHQRAPASDHHERLGKAVADFVRHWRSAGKLVHHTPDTAKLAHVFAPTFQREFLERVYPQYTSAFCSVEESLGLQCVDRPMLATLVLLLQWIKKHDTRLVADLARPTSHQGLVKGTADATVGAGVGVAGTSAGEAVLVGEGGAMVEGEDGGAGEGGGGAHHPPVRCYNELYVKLDVFDPQGRDAVDDACHIDVGGFGDYEGGGGGQRSLYAHLNRCQTKMGARLLRERLVRLSTDPAALEARYALVEGIQGDAATRAVLDAHLRSPDLARMYRRFGLANLQPHDLPRLVQAQHDLGKVVAHLAGLPKTHALAVLLRQRRAYNGLSARLTAYQAELAGLFDLDACTHTSFANGNGAHLTVSLFRRGVCADVDAAVDAYTARATALDTLARALEAWVPGLKLPTGTTAWVHVKQNDKDGHWLDVSKTRYTKLKAALAKGNAAKVAAFEATTQGLWSLDELEFDTKNKTNVKISGPGIRSHSQALQAAQQALATAVRTEYARQLQRLHQAHYAKTVEPLMTLVARLDVAHATARLATQHGYVRPVIGREVETETTAGPSFVEATALRHPLIERLLAASRKTEYVPNDVALSKDACYLLHGVNSVGKSSLLKSVALAVMMAQAGLYVAASSFRFAPYTKLFARTGNDDNLHRHHSSFVKEMSETKQIVDHADARSLVIADELCASTELDSAVRIVATLLTLLGARQTSFLFATHLFALQDDPRVQQLLAAQTLRNVHLHVAFRDGQLAFERTLRPGLPTNRTYGVLVADKVIAHPEFTAMLEAGEATVGPAVTPETPAVHPSKYNAQLWVDRCEVCGYQPTTAQHTPLEVHHIHEQQSADAMTGLIDRRFHKNERHNLAVLCKPCHQAIDTGELMVFGHTSTLAGDTLMFYRPGGCGSKCEAGVHAASECETVASENATTFADATPAAKPKGKSGKSKYTAAQRAAVRAYALEHHPAGQTKAQWWRATKAATGVDVGYKKFCAMVG